jgi:single-stranded DNA-binding protein
MKFNQVQLLGRVVDEELEPRIIGKEKTDGERPAAVLNFRVEYFDKEDDCFYRLPIAVWGTKDVNDCLEHLEKGSLVFVQGELRYKYIFEKNEVGERKLIKVYTNVKASRIEFMGEKIKSPIFKKSINEVRLFGNLRDDPVETEEGFVVAVDRMLPSKENIRSADYSTDYVHLVIKNKELIQRDDFKELKKGSAVIIDGKLMTRKINEEIVRPTIVVSVKDIVGE